MANTSGDMSKKVLSFGLPKGSLQEATFQKMAKAGWNISVSSRSYVPYVDDEELKSYHQAHSGELQARWKALHRDLQSRLPEHQRIPEISLHGPSKETPVLDIQRPI